MKGGGGREEPQCSYYGLAGLRVRVNEGSTKLVLSCMTVSF